MNIHLRRGALAMSLLAATSMGLVAVPAHADTAPAPEQLTYTTQLVETNYGKFNKVTSTNTYDVTDSGGTAETDTGDYNASSTSGTGTVSPMTETKGGTSSASGCKKLAVTHTAYTYLGFVAWRFSIWTHWCWKRSTQTVYNVYTGWNIWDVDSEYKWDGIVDGTYIHLFYDYSTNDGHPKSAFKHQRTGHFENCVIKWGCVGNIYPTDLLRSYYNGTYAWDSWT